MCTGVGFKKGSNPRRGAQREHEKSSSGQNFSFFSNKVGTRLYLLGLKRNFYVEWMASDKG